MAIVNSAGAQDVSGLKDKTPVERAAFQTGMMKTKLALDSPQLKKVQAINLKYAQKMQPILKSEDSKFSRMRQAMAIQKAKDAELKTVFTTDQYKKYQDFESEMRAKMKAALGN
jgi:hypothetical protein